MHSVQQAIEAFRRATGLTALALDEDGRAEILVDGKWPVEFHGIDEETLELAAPVDEIDGSESSAKLIGLLKANYLGEGTGAARLSVDAEAGLVMLCERIHVAEINEAQFERRVLEFLRHVAFWNSDEIETLLNGRGNGGVGKADAPPVEGFVVRI